MKWQATLTIAVLSLVATAAAAAETDGGKHLLILGLRDGSRLRGTTRLESIPMDTPHGKFGLSVERIRTIAFAEKPAKGGPRPEARADFRGGDVLHGRILQKTFELDTPYGKTTVPVARIVRMDVWPVGLAAGLVGFWTGDGHAMDGLGKHHGTHPEAVTYTTDRYGNPRGAFCFNGQGGLVTLPDHDELDTDNAFTLTVWINPKAYRNKAGEEGWILSRHYDSTVHGNYGDYILRLLTNGKILFRVENYAKKVRRDGLGSAAAVPKDAWTHVAVTFDRGAMYLYINGKLVAGKASTAVKCTDPREYPHDDVYIGAVWNNGGSFTGAIDDVGIWNRALSAVEVAELAGTDSAGGRPAGPAVCAAQGEER